MLTRDINCLSRAACFVPAAEAFDLGVHNPYRLLTGYNRFLINRLEWMGPELLEKPSVLLSDIFGAN